MKAKNKNGFIQIILSYLILWIPIIIQNIIKSKDIIFIFVIISLLIMVDAKMKYKNKFVNLNFYIMLCVFILLLYASMILHK